MVRNRKLASVFPRSMATGWIGARRRAESVSLACSRRKEGSSMSVPAKRMAIQSRPGPKRRDSSRGGSKLKLKRKTTIRGKTEGGGGRDGGGEIRFAFTHEFCRGGHG